MEIAVEREPSVSGATLGTLYIDGVRQCYTLEDQVRPAGIKIWGQTAIPAGRYALVLTWSPKFGRLMPLLLSVPGFEGVRIHWGNEPKDTEGCILVGDVKAYARILQSRLAFEELWRKLAKPGATDGDWELREPTWVTIRNPEPAAPDVDSEVAT